LAVATTVAQAVAIRALALATATTAVQTAVPVRLLVTVTTAVQTAVPVRLLVTATAALVVSVVHSATATVDLLSVTVTTVVQTVVVSVVHSATATVDLLSVTVTTAAQTAAAVHHLVIATIVVQTVVVSVVHSATATIANVVRLQPTAMVVAQTASSATAAATLALPGLAKATQTRRPSLKTRFSKSLRLLTSQRSQPSPLLKRWAFTLAC
jgi:hypothetical protein